MQSCTRSKHLTQTLKLESSLNLPPLHQGSGNVQKDKVERMEELEDGGELWDACCLLDYLHKTCTRKSQLKKEEEVLLRSHSILGALGR